MLMPAIARLRGKARITLLGRSPGIDFLRPHVSACLDMERMGWHRLYMDMPDPDHAPALPELGPIDQVVAFSADSQKGIEKNLRSLFSGSAVHIFPPFPGKEEKTHVALYLARCLQSAGLPLDAAACLAKARERPVLAPGPQADRTNRIVFHPGSGSPIKNHPPDFWLTLRNALKQARGPHLQEHCLLLGPAEEDMASLFQAQPEDPSLQIVITPPKETLVSLLAGAALCIAHDSGIAHLAAMLGTPTIALFIQSSAAQWAPLGPRVRILENQRGDPSLVGRVMKAAGILTGKDSPGKSDS